MSETEHLELPQGGNSGSCGLIVHKGQKIRKGTVGSL